MQKQTQQVQFDNYIQIFSTQKRPEKFTSSPDKIVNFFNKRLHRQKPIIKFVFSERSRHPSEVSIDPIGSTRTFQDRRMASFRRTILARGGSQDELNSLTATELVNYNPLLKNYTPTTRLAYAKFKSFNIKNARGLKTQDSITEENLEKATLNEVNETSSAKLMKLSSVVDRGSRHGSLRGSLHGSLHGSLNNLSIKEDVDERSSPQKNNEKVQQKSAEEGLMDDGANVDKKSGDKKLIEFSPNQSRQGSGVVPANEERSADLTTELPEDSPFNRGEDKRMPVLKKQFSQDNPTYDPTIKDFSKEAPKASPRRKRGSKGGTPNKSPHKSPNKSPNKSPKMSSPHKGTPPNNGTSPSKKSNNRSPSKSPRKSPKKYASPKSPPKANTATLEVPPTSQEPTNSDPVAQKAHSPKALSPKIFPQDQERKQMGIQSPFASPLNQPLSPLPPKNIPLASTKRAPAPKAPVVAPRSPPAPKSPPEATPEKPASPVQLPPAPTKPTTQDPPPDGKSVITGQIRTGWL